MTELQQWYFSNESRAYHKIVYGRELTNEELSNLSWAPIYVSSLIQEIDPDYINAHFVLGINFAKKGDINSALDEYKILKELDIDLANKLFDLFINKKNK